MPRRAVHSGRGRMPHVASDDTAAYSEGEAPQMPPSSSQASYNGGSDYVQQTYAFSRHHPSAGGPSRSYSTRSPPRAPPNMRDNRSVTPPPPQMPSSSYLLLSEQDPSRLDDPTTSRKLLVLDLNGTLLHRSPPNFRPKSRTAAADFRKRDRHGNFLPRLRPVHPRPYMPAFRNYLFHPRTKEWLDVMVWSSAQPHSVGDMVDKCFEEHKDDLLAVWARDTLGLSNEHYFRKVQTVKDLAKPWSLLSPKPTDTLPSPRNSISSTPRTSPEPASPSRPSDDSIRPAVEVSPQAHSALTTLLLDDSPRKAELQPFNHVCLGEYSGEKRVKDLESLQKEQELAAALHAREQMHAYTAASGEVDATAAASATVTTTAGSGSGQGTALDADVAEGEPSKKRKRKEKKLQKRAALLEQMSSGRDKPAVIYDETLLAVIGVLGEIKSQANIAAWIRAGGLWGPHGLPTCTSDSHKVEVVATTATTLPRSSRVTLDALEAGAEDKAAAESDDSTLSVEEAKAGKRKKKRARVHGPTAVLAVDVEGGGDVVAVGNDEVTAVPALSLHVPETVAEPESEEQKMWFEHADVFAYWAGRGRKMLEELDIPVEHGIER